MAGYSSTFERMIMEANPPSVKTRDDKGNFVCPHGGPCKRYTSASDEEKPNIERQTCKVPGVDCGYRHLD